MSQFKRVLLFSLCLFPFCYSLPYLAQSSPQFQIHYPFDGESRLKGVYQAYLLGDKSRLSVQDKTIHRHFHLLHLFTPSGLHFSSLLFVLMLVLTPWKRSQGIILLKVILFLLPFFLPGFYAIKRIALLYLIGLFFKKHLQPFTLFLITFFIDFIFGTFAQSPLSYAYSFLFLGTIMASLYERKFIFFIHLAKAQLLAAILSSQAFFPLGLLVGFLATTIFTFLFPVLLMGILHPQLMNLSFYGLEFFHWFLVQTFQLPMVEIQFFPGPSLLLILFGSKSRHFFFGLLLLSTPCLNSPQKSYASYKSNQGKSPPSPVLRVTRTYYGYKSWHQQGIVCHHRLMPHRWRYKCYYLD